MFTFIHISWEWIIQKWLLIFPSICFSSQISSELHPLCCVGCTQQPLPALLPTEHPQDFCRQRHSKAFPISQQMYRRAEKVFTSPALGSNKDPQSRQPERNYKSQNMAQDPSPLLPDRFVSDPILSLNQPLISCNRHQLLQEGSGSWGLTFSNSVSKAWTQTKRLLF